MTDAKPIRILIITNHFYPESFRVNDVAFELNTRGYEVTVLTAIPDYPQGKFYKGYGYFKRRSELIDGVKVVRAAVIPRGKGSAIRMMLNYLSVIAGFMLQGLRLGLTKKYDYIFVHDTSPAFIILAAILIKKIQRIALDLWILDMWPESLIAGGIKNKWIHKVIQKMMDYCYKHCDTIHTSSRGFRQMLHKRGVADNKIIYLPNWSDSAMSQSSDVEIPQMPQGFTILFAGNLGEAQNLENVLKAADKTKDSKDIHWVFVGNGRKIAWMQDFVKSHHLEENVHFMGKFPIEAMPSFFKKADIMLVSLKDELVFNMTLPAKVQAYMANAKPILGMLNGEGADIIKEAQCGLCVDADDIDGMADTITRLARVPKEKLQEMGKNGYDYYMNHFQQNICIDIICNSIEKRPII